ncbi:carbon-nitrogen family hydrolase [Brevibacillus halotolerans]|uniref:carbon-nitrogen family hydrolase n=1 Tax=Brevibacillus laterosporus TaxID=1465 RepID=UPI00215D1E2B|nr:carbon-nitrogen family hydrolase [Brevibacillus laterosporus]MCR8997515.1 carbon-nitrogen family hydrolase [Brevibacillus laterosporus]WPS89319.1 carbon-nitrogen family hydrolase [Brevibacillus halotolerans]
MSNKWRIALIQMDVVLGNPEANREKVKKMTENLRESGKGIDALLLPELWDTAYDLERLDEIADEQGKNAQMFLKELARSLHSYVYGGSIAEHKENGVYNTSYVFDKQGNLVGSYSKAHLFKLMNEHQFLQSGDQLGLYQMDDQKVGAVICYDIRFPEWIRLHAVKGAKVLFVCAQWPNPRLAHWRALLIARAIENQMYVVACNRVGSDSASSFFGHSMVIDPWGEVIAEAGEEEMILTAEIDLDIVDQVRSKIPVFTDRRPDIYN